MRKTKIICTIGPSCKTREQLKNLIKAGMNVARINMSHGDYLENKNIFETIINVRKEMNVPLSIMLDTKGPEIRIGTFENPNGIILNKGQEFVLSTKPCNGTQHEVFVNYEGIVNDVKIGNKILVNDGLIELKVVRVEKEHVFCKVLIGGKLTERKACFVPSVTLNMPYLSEQDKIDLKLAVELKLDYVAASFVSKKDDAIEIRNYLNKIGGKDIKLIAKIESVAGVKNVKEICDFVDGIMVARGDLGVEYNLEKLPAVQKTIIDAARSKGLLLIMATEMLESMTNNIRPTRAEANDVANAVFDNCSAVMLSGETAIGKHPCLVVETMAKICMSAENAKDYDNEFSLTKFNINNISEAIGHSAVRCAFDLKSKCIVAFTLRGNIARIISSFNSNANILALTTSEQTYNKLAFYFGVNPIMCKNLSSAEEMFKFGREEAIKRKFVKKGDNIIISTGDPVGISGQTNLIKVLKV